MTDYIDDENRKLSEFAEDIKLFGKWEYPEVDHFNPTDTSLKDQMNWKPRWYPHTAGRWQKKRFRKIQCPIVERLVNCLMMHGRNSGKKLYVNYVNYVNYVVDYFLMTNL